MADDAYWSLQAVLRSRDLRVVEGWLSDPQISRSPTTQARLHAYALALSQPSSPDPPLWSYAQLVRRSDTILQHISSSTGGVSLSPIEPATSLPACATLRASQDELSRARALIASNVPLQQAAASDLPAPADQQPPQQAVRASSTEIEAGRRARALIEARLHGGSGHAQPTVDSEDAADAEAADAEAEADSHSQQVWERIRTIMVAAGDQMYPRPACVQVESF